MEEDGRRPDCRMFDKSEEVPAVKYSVHPVVEGFPGKSASHGAFGWSSVWLLRGNDRVILVETGPPAYIPLISAFLDRCGLGPEDVTDVLLTHAHWDHLSNIMMFPRATLWIGAEELAWARTVPRDAPFMSTLHTRELQERGRGTGLVSHGDTILPGVTVIATPGHTPGHVSYTVETESGSVIFAGDAVKNIYELTTLNIDSTLDAGQSRASIRRLREQAGQMGARIVPGHDVVLQQEGNSFMRTYEQRAEISVFPGKEDGEVDRSITATND